MKIATAALLIATLCACGVTRQAREGPDGVQDHHRRQDVEREQRADEIAVLRRLGGAHVERDEGENGDVRAGYRQHALDAAAFCLIGDAELRT